MKAQISDSFSFGEIAKIGWVITTYLLKTPKFQNIINKKIEENQRDQIMKTMSKDQ